MHLAAIYVYPVKSLRGIRLEEAELDDAGLRHDRRWMLVDPEGAFLTQREHPRLALVSTALDAERLCLAAPGMPELRVPLAPPAGPAVEVRVWRDRVPALGHPPEVDGWLSDFLGAPCRLVRMPEHARRAMDGAAGPDAPRIAFSDGYPLHLLSEASLADLNRRLAEPVGVERFRPNLVIAGAEPYAEDGWARFRIGAMELDDVAPCTRCAITTVDPARGTRGKEPLRTLATYRLGPEGVEMGRYAVHRGPGTLRVGDRAEVRSEK